MNTKPMLGNNLDDILRAFKAKSEELSGLRIVEAAVIGGSLRFRYQGNGSLGVVVHDICLRDAKPAEVLELEDAIELGQAQIYTTPLYVQGRVMTKEVLHESTGSPLDPNSPAARALQARLERAYGKPAPMALEEGWTRLDPHDESTFPKRGVRVRAKVRNCDNYLVKESTLYRSYEVDTDVSWFIEGGGELSYNWDVVAWQPL